MNEAVLNFFTGTRAEWLTPMVLVVTYAGSYVVVSCLTFLSAFIFYLRRQGTKILPLFISVFGSAATVFVLKNIFFETRPALALYLETDSAFPSGHATAAVALYGFLIYAICKSGKSFFKKFISILLFILILLVGASRLYLGVHYLSDVIAGFALGVIWLFMGAAIEKKIERLMRWKPPFNSVQGK